MGFYKLIRCFDERYLTDRYIIILRYLNRSLGNYGANIGAPCRLIPMAMILRVRAKAKAAAGSDARMNGCGELPVVINSGSGNKASPV